MKLSQLYSNKPRVFLPIRFHGVTDIPLVHMQGFEFTANYLYARGRGIVVNEPSMVVVHHPGLGGERFGRGK